jgi:hypothetical protein
MPDGLKAFLMYIAAWFAANVMVFATNAIFGQTATYHDVMATWALINTFYIFCKLDKK